jgi:hypothetical protein
MERIVILISLSILILILLLTIYYSITRTPTPTPKQTSAPVILAPTPVILAPALAPAPVILAPALAPAPVILAPAPVILAPAPTLKPTPKPILFTFTSTSLENDEIKPTSKQLKCKVNDDEKYTCINPVNNKMITLTSGPLFKISSSVEIDTFDKQFTDYYIMGSLSFMTQGFISIATNEIIISTLNDLLKFFNDYENIFNKENNIPDKCINVSKEIRLKSEEPYNTMCIFFPGLKTIHTVVKILELSLFPFLPNNVLNDYYNMINAKINNESSVTVLEYTMYLGLLNKIKTSNFKYYTICTTESDTITVNC